MTGDSLLDTMLMLVVIALLVFGLVGVPVAIREWWEDRNDDDEVVADGTLRPGTGGASMEDQRRTAGVVVERHQPAGVRQSHDDPTEQFVVGSEDATEPLPTNRGG
jgi:hypothetical protein